MRPADVAKAIAAGCVAAGAGLGAAAADDGITAAEAIIVVLGALGAALTVWATPNAPGKKDDVETVRQEPL